MIAPPATTVIIVAYHGASWIPSCLETLRTASQGPIRLCLVDNGGNGEALATNPPGFECMLLRTPSSLGFAEANNFALRQVLAAEPGGPTTPFVCFLNQDTLSRPGWLDDCEACLEHTPGAGAVSPLLRTYDDRGWDPGFWDCAKASPEFLSEVVAGRSSNGFYSLPRVTAAAMLVRSRVLQEVGPFDPIFGSYYEDYDLCHRIRRAGFQIGICAPATVCHHSGSSTTTEAARRKRMRQVIRNRTIVQIREAGPARWRKIAHYLACTMPWNFLRSLLRTPSSQPLPVQIQAHWELLGEWRRLISERYDRRVWTEYLGRIDWPDGAEPTSGDRMCETTARGISAPI